MARTPAEVVAVVCTRNSINGIKRCLESLRAANVGEIVVVDANSTDGTRAVVEQVADRVLQDPGIGLGNARNIGIASTTAPLILNFGSDNVLPEGQLQKMIDYLERYGYQGVSAQTRIAGSDFISRGLNAWRTGRFPPGPTMVIGTPSLFDGQLLRKDPYRSDRRFSDDSELCERWAMSFDARFAISWAYVEEVGKASWRELWIRCRMYGVSDAEVYAVGRASGWTAQRRLKSLMHPLRADFIKPLCNLKPRERIQYSPFMLVFSLARYWGWILEVRRQRKERTQ